MCAAVGQVGTLTGWRWTQVLSSTRCTPFNHFHGGCTRDPSSISIYEHIYWTKCDLEFVGKDRISELATLSGHYAMDSGYDLDSTVGSSGGNWPYLASTGAIPALESFSGDALNIIDVVVG